MVDRQVTRTPEIPAIPPIGGIDGIDPIAALPPIPGIGPAGLLAFKVGELPASVQPIFRRGVKAWPKVLDEAIAQGIKDVDELADIVFFLHHPERVRSDGVGTPIDPDEQDAVKLQAEREYHADVVKRRLDPAFAPSVFLPERKSSDYDDFVAAPTTGRLKLMVNGRNRSSPTAADDQFQAFKDMRATIESLEAGSTIYLTTWEFKPLVVPLEKGATKTWGDLFKEKAQQGVRMRFIISVHPVDVFMSNLVALDGLIRSLPADKVDNLKYIGSLHPAKIGPQHVGDHHQKFMIVKKGTWTVAWCGGLDITASRTPVHWTDSLVWHDIHARLEGRIVKDLEREFVERWNREKDAAKTSTIGAWKAADIVPVWKSGFEILKASPIEKEDKDAPINVHAVQMHRTVSSAGWIYPITKRDDIWRSYFKLIARAKRFLFLENQYFHEPALAAPLVTQMQAQPSLVLLIVIATGSDDDSSHEYVRHQYLLRDEFFRKLLLADRTLWRRMGVYTMFYAGGIVHSKLIIADDEALSMGSANANQRGFYLDSELNVMLEDPAAVKEFRVRLWAHDLGQDPKEVAKWSPGEFVTRWDKLADVNRAKRTKPLTMLGESIDHYAPLDKGDPKSIHKLMAPWSVIGSNHIVL